VFDEDSGRYLPDDVVESFAVDVQTQQLGSGVNTLYNGTFGFASAGLSFEIECLPGFTGENCIAMHCSRAPCSNGGTCLQSASGFTCACRGDFTGETCQTRINDCQGVECNDGTCVDGVQSFTCQCQEGYTGQFCDLRTENSATVGVGAVAGAVSSGAVLLLITVILVCLTVLYYCKRRNSSLEGTICINPYAQPQSHAYKLYYIVKTAI